MFIIRQSLIIKSTVWRALNLLEVSARDLVVLVEIDALCHHREVIVREVHLL